MNAMPAVDKAALLATRGIGTRMVEVGSIGAVEVRGLTRAEALSIQGRGDLDAVEMEALLLSIAMASPVLTEDEVKQWQQVAPAGELEPIQDAILEMSGMKAAAVKEQMKRFRG